MEAHLAPTQPTQVNKIMTSCEICNGPHDTQYCMEDPEQAFVEYASSRTDEAGDAILSKFKAAFKQQQSEMTNKIDIVLEAITDRIAGTLPSNTVKNPKLSASLVLSAYSYLNMDSQNAQTMSKVRSTPSQSIMINKATPMIRKQIRMRKKKRKARKISMSTPSHHPIHQLHSSLKKSSNSIHSSNRSDWFLNNPTSRSFAQRGTIEKSFLLS
ncbi:hypothetical protein Tco_0053258 [Tanacetum coccineum]